MSNNIRIRFRLIFCFVLLLIWPWPVENRAASAKVITYEGTEQNLKVSIRIPTAKEEFGYVLNVVRHQQLFRKHGYTIDLPNHEVFEKLALQAPHFTQKDKKIAFNTFIHSVFKESDYHAGLSVLGDLNTDIQQVLHRLHKLHELWGFRLFPKYDIVLTLYGSGGEYRPDTGQIILKTTKSGSFKRKDPLHTIAHEIVHIGIHENIVRQHNLTHWEKERVVDRICSIWLGDILESYTIQPKGDARIDQYVTKKGLTNLPKAIESYRISNKRHPTERSITSSSQIMIKRVIKGTQAETIGLRKGDIIISYDGISIKNTARLIQEVKKKSNKKELTLIIEREGKKIRFIIKGGSIGVKITQVN